MKHQTKKIIKKPKIHKKYEKIHKKCKKIVKKYKKNNKKAIFITFFVHKGCF